MSETMLAEIERLTKTYAEARGLLATRVDDLQMELDAIKRRKLAGIKAAVSKAADAEAALRTALEAAPDLFSKPKTLVLYGIRVGYQKLRGQLNWDDEEAVVGRIQRLYPEQLDTLLIVTMRPSKTALAQLPAADLKRLGVTVMEAGETVIVKPTDTEVDKLVDALLKDARETATEAA